MFTDRVTLKVSAGKGGNGVVAWRREKYIPKGGPTGGNGGNGGNIIFEASPHELCLETYRNRRFLKAENGAQGGSNSKHGRSGNDLVIKIPCGTLLKDAQSGVVLCDLTEAGQQWIACHGGHGGRGNESFKTATNRAPNQFTSGKEGEMKELELELKLIGDVGLVGFPNAGKSTLISALADVKVKIAPYPFTTLRPNLAYVDFEDYTRILMADIPGLIEGAHQNRGLGFEFLRHVERNKALIFVLDASGIDGRTPWADFQVLRDELNSYKVNLLEKPFMVLLNKVDTEEAQDHMKEFYEHFPYDFANVREISALEETGLDEVLKDLQALMVSAPV